MSPLEVLGTIIGSICTVLGGVFALIRYVINQNSKNNKAFLDHLIVKNGILERVSLEFSKRIDRVDKASEERNEKLNDTLNNLARIIERNKKK